MVKISLFQNGKFAVSFAEFESGDFAGFAPFVLVVRDVFFAVENGSFSGFDCDFITKIVAGFLAEAVGLKPAQAFDRAGGKFHDVNAGSACSLMHSAGIINDKFVQAVLIDVGQRFQVHRPAALGNPHG